MRQSEKTSANIENAQLHRDDWQHYPLTGQPFLAPLRHLPLSQLQSTTNQLERPTYELVSDPARLQEVISNYLAAAPLLAIDTETTGLDQFTARLLIIQIATPEKCFIFNATRLPSLAPLKSVLENPFSLKLLQNGKFDYKILKMQAGGIELQNIYDTYLAERVLTCGQSREMSSLALQALVERYTGFKLDKSIRLTFNANLLLPNSNFEEEHSDVQADKPVTPSSLTKIPHLRLNDAQLHYAARDVFALFPVYAAQLPRLKNDSLLPTLHLECACIGPVADMELAGVKLDVAKWRETLNWARNERNKVEAEIMAMLPGGVPQQLNLPGFGPLNSEGSYLLNLNSSHQVLDAFRKLGIDYIRGTSERELEKYEHRHPIIAKLIEYRGFEKMLSSFGENILARINGATGRLHPEFLQIGADTGRFSCTNPNLQQIPTNSRFRECFVAAPGYKLVVADYRQAELAILAAVSGDEALLEAFKSRQDLHKLAASRMFGVPLAKITKEQRAAGKAINFGMAYGMSAANLGKRLGKTTKEAEELIAAYFAAFPKIKGWLDEAGRFAQQHGYNLTPIGRRRYYRQLSVEDIGDDEFRARQFRISRRAKSSFMQGGNADVTKLALIFLKERLSETDVDSKRKYEARVVNTIHDEVVVEVVAAQAEQVRELVQDEMERAGEVILGQRVLGADVVVSDFWSK